MANLIRKFKIKGLPSEKEFAALPFGRQMDHLRAIAVFSTECKSTYLSQKRQTYQKAIREAIKLFGAKEYYCDFHCGSDYKDDSFQFWYR